MPDTVPSCAIQLLEEMGPQARILHIGELYLLPRDSDCDSDDLEPPEPPPKGGVQSINFRRDFSK